MTPRSLCDRLDDVALAIDRAVRFAQADREDEIVVAAVLHELTVIGEAVNTLLRSDPDLPDRRPGIPWHAIVAMRHRLVHEYDRVDPAFVWGTVDGDLGPLRAAIEQEQQGAGCP